MQIGARIREAAAAREVSLNELARRAGLSRSYVAALVNARVKDPRLSTLRKIAAALEMDVGDLIDAQKDEGGASTSVQVQRAGRRSPDLLSGKVPPRTGYTTLGQNIRRLRDMRKISRPELAKAAGLEESEIADVEAGRNHNPDLFFIVRCADALDYDWQELLIDDRGRPIDRPRIPRAPGAKSAEGTNNS